MDPFFEAIEREYLAKIEAEKNQPANLKIAICKECPSLLHITNMCKECGCLIYAKVHWPNASCPKGKW